MTMMIIEFMMGSRYRSGLYEKLKFGPKYAFLQGFSFLGALGSLKNEAQRMGLTLRCNAKERCDDSANRFKSVLHPIVHPRKKLLNFCKQNRRSVVDFSV